MLLVGNRKPERAPCLLAWERGRAVRHMIQWYHVNAWPIRRGLKFICRGDGMVDIGDLKSPELISRVGSSPTPGTGMDFLYGKLEQAPEGFCPPEMWPEYAIVSQPTWPCTSEGVGKDPSGVRWGLWPFTFEDYISDKEPNLQESRKGTLARNRVITWERVRKTNIPRGWMQFSRAPSRIDGVLSLDQDQDYTLSWNKNARRDLRIFKDKVASGLYAVVPISMDAFAGAYRQSLIAQRVDLRRLEDLERKFAHPAAQGHIKLWGVRNTQTDAIVAGTAINYSPTYKNSTHIAPFILEEGRHLCAATGLIDHWFAESIKHGCTFATTLNFWFKGQPKEWRGFSEFKSHFGFQFVAYPPRLYKFVLGKIF
ncbi:MAG: hypothetical protein JWL87_17 [Candidatus Adlerbacteria bacterium]|nr:hypothetical protein [Candidatus Adlerbacteria bacterium]